MSRMVFVNRGEIRYVLYTRDVVAADMISADISDKSCITREKAVL